MSHDDHHYGAGPFGPASPGSHPPGRPHPQQQTPAGWPQQQTPAGWPQPMSPEMARHQAQLMGEGERMVARQQRAMPIIAALIVVAGVVAWASGVAVHYALVIVVAGLAVGAYWYRMRGMVQAQRGIMAEMRNEAERRSRY